MHSPAAALSWEFWARHRIGLSVVVVLVVGFAVACAISPLSKNNAAVHSLWLVLGLCYVIGVFAYGFEGRLETAESGFPARLFLLPVRTWVLVGWPMLQGMIVAVGLWLAWDRLVLRPSGIETGAWWPVMLAAVVATSQAIVWLPFGLPWLRLLVAIVVLTALIRAPAFLDLAGERFSEPETRNTVLSTFAAALIPLAFLVAWAGVSRARRGDTPDWLRAWGSVRSVARPGSRAAGPFHSAMAAQVWYEWRVRGFGFVVTVALVLAALMTLAVLLERDAAKRANFGVIFLLTPMLLAPFWSSYAGMSGASVRSAQLTTFAATRPLSNSALVRAKFRSAGWAAVSAWGVVLVVFPAWLFFTGGYRDLGRIWGVMVERFGTAHVFGYCALLVIGPLLMSWRMMVVGLWAGLTGRAYIPVVQSIVVGFFGLQFMSEWILWSADPVRRERILEFLPWAAGSAVAGKFIVTGWAAAALLRRGELAAGTLAKLIGAWAVLVACLFGVLAWLIPSDAAPRYGLALGAVLFVPFARLIVAPLAFAWNRHR
jgi:hypothetical protein